jgi:hypothetical protein
MEDRNNPPTRKVAVIVGRTSGMLIVGIALVIGAWWSSNASNDQGWIFLHRAAIPLSYGLLILIFTEAVNRAGNDQKARFIGWGASLLVMGIALALGAKIAIEVGAIEAGTDYGWVFLTQAAFPLGIGLLILVSSQASYSSKWDGDHYTTKGVGVGVWVGLLFVGTALAIGGKAASMTGHGTMELSMLFGNFGAVSWIIIKEGTSVAAFFAGAGLPLSIGFLILVVAQTSAGTSNPRTAKLVGRGLGLVVVGIALVLGVSMSQMEGTFSVLDILVLIDTPLGMGMLIFVISEGFNPGGDKQMVKMIGRGSGLLIVAIPLVAGTVSFGEVSYINNVLIFMNGVAIPLAVGLLILVTTEAVDTVPVTAEIHNARSEPQKLVLDYLRNHNFVVSRTEMESALGYSAEEVESALNWLRERKFIRL